MRAVNLAKEDQTWAGKAVGCLQCRESKEIVAKYRKLVDLMNKKIRQLEKKNKSNIKTQQVNTMSRVDLDQCIEKGSHIFSTQKSLMTLQNAITRLENPNATPLLPQPPQTTTQIPPQKPQTAQREHLQQMQKISLVINGLTEQVMQLKSNLMHIRHCVYAFFKAVDIGEKVFGQNIALNITLALISIFQFSQNQKEEMFNNKKVKHRKKILNESKENVFVTIKEI